jgi:hypothetical protein
MVQGLRGEGGGVEGAGRQGHPKHAHTHTIVLVVLVLKQVVHATGQAPPNIGYQFLERGGHVLRLGVQHLTHPHQSANGAPIQTHTVRGA